MTDPLPRFLILWTEAAAGDADLRELFIERDAWLSDRFAREIGNGKQDGPIRTEVDSVAAAGMFAGTLHGLSLQWMVTPPTELKYLRELMTDMLRRSIASTKK